MTSTKIEYGMQEFMVDINALCKRIDKEKYWAVYGVPQGGVPVAMQISKVLGLSLIANIPENALLPSRQKDVLVVDDVVDSGATRLRYQNFDFAALHVKPETPKNAYPTLYQKVKDGWIDYWWENKNTNIQDNIIRLLQYMGEDANREGLLETPDRVIRSYSELYAGYKMEVTDILKTFSSDGYDEIVLLKDIELYSMCEHHMLPFVGKAHVAYIPDEKVIGISKLARLVEIFARRLQIQERLGNQITEALMEHLKPKAAACVIEAQHFCMRMRGIRKQNSVMTTSSLKGIFIEDSAKGLAARNEIMRLIR